ncbi:MAG: type III pantothenate kinase [Gammaproteobacteria bacterium]|nr:type III pantothenate kinase [Gammaproteobacteria bacterium]
MLTIDIGNSGVKWGIWQENMLILADDGYYKKETLQATLDDIFSGSPEQDAVWVSCVAGQEVEHVLTEWIRDKWSIEPVFLRTSSELGGVSNMYPSPEEHGVDRWAALLGAKKLYDFPVCIIDAGTAITIDLMDASGVHRGGRILPGLEMMRKSLLQNTAGVRAVEGGCPGFAINTADAVTSGIVHMLQAGLLEVCEEARKRLGDKMRIILTGGMAEKMLAFLAQVKGVHREPHLVLYGLYYAWEQESANNKNDNNKE